MTASDLFAEVTGELLIRGHNVSTMCNVLWCGNQMIAEFRADRVRVFAAQVFNGRAHVVPDGCDVSTVTPGSRYATVERIVAAIEKRMAARAASLPVPVDAGAIVRDP